MQHNRAPWPDRYYEEFNPEKRLRLLEEAISAGEGDGAENELRRTLWEMRYEKGHRGAPPADRYIALWLALNRWRQKGLSPLQARNAGRELRGLAGVIRPQGRAELVQPLLHRELVHAVRLYLNSCVQGSYGTVMLGMMRMSSDKLIEKAAREVAEVTCLVPRWAGLAGELAPLAPAAREAFPLVFPDGEEALEQALGRCGAAKAGASGEKKGEEEG